jgi:hypothetical protein
MIDGKGRGWRREERRGEGGEMEKGVELGRMGCKYTHGTDGGG